MPLILCEREGCTKGAVRGGTPHCVAHGGGKCCEGENCTKSAQAALGFVSRARRWKAMPARGLPQGCSTRWHAALQGAWRGQALQGGGLHQGS